MWAILEATNIIVQHNVADHGGGILNNGQQFLSDSTLDDNVASGWGGGILNFGDTDSQDSSTLRCSVLPSAATGRTVAGVSFILLMSR